MERKRKTGGVKRTVLIILCIILAVILALMLAATVYYEVLLGRLGRVRPDEGSGRLFSGEFTQPTDSRDPNDTSPDLNDVTMPSGAADVIESEHINILLIGQDARPGEGIQRSDVMMLCTVDTGSKTITLTSFQRDLYVTIPGFWESKLTHAFAYGGYFGTAYNGGSGTSNGMSDAIAVLDNTLTYNFGVQIDGNIVVDFESFEAVIDAVGGVDIELTGDEADYINSYLGTYSLSSGWNHLNGAEALMYARTRNVGNGDFGRTNRQRTVITALIDKARGMGIADLNNLLMTVLPLVTTDLTNADITGYALSVLPMLSGCSVVTQQIPAEGTYQLGWRDDMSVILADFEANRQLLRDTIG